jgi:hypothetical protein
MGLRESDQRGSEHWWYRTANVQLGNSGGIITLLDENGLKVDGVSYTQGQSAARRLDNSILTKLPIGSL